MRTGCQMEASQWKRLLTILSPPSVRGREWRPRSVGGPQLRLWESGCSCSHPCRPRSGAWLWGGRSRRDSPQGLTLVSTCCRSHSGHFVANEGISPGRSGGAKEQVHSPWKATRSLPGAAKSAPKMMRPGPGCLFPGGSEVADDNCLFPSLPKVIFKNVIIESHAPRKVHKSYTYISVAFT